jgi:glycosyltransferase 2 family protein
VRRGLPQSQSPTDSPPTSGTIRVTNSVGGPESGHHPVEREPQAATSPGGGLLRRGIATCFGLAAVGFGAIFIASHWSQFTDALSSASPRWVALAVFAAVLSFTAGMLSFRAVLGSATSEHVGVDEAARIFYLSQLGKYVPGWVWPAVATVTLSRKLGVTPRDGASVWAVSLAVSLLGGGAVGLTASVAVFGNGFWYAALALAAAICLIWFATHPALLRRLLAVAMKIIRRPDVTLRLTPDVMRRATSWSVLGWVLGGLHCWALVVALGGDPWTSLAPSIAGFALALVAGTLFLPAPGGIGVREFVLAATLGGTLEGVQPGSGQLLAIVVLSRVILAFLDFAMAGGVLLLAPVASRSRVR